MNIKQQNAQLAENKRHFMAILEELDIVCNESVEILGCNPDDDFAQDWVWDYLNGNAALKTVREKIKKNKSDNYI